MTQELYQFQCTVCLGGEIRLYLKEMPAETEDQEVRERYAKYQMFRSDEVPDNLALDGTLQAMTASGKVHLLLHRANMNYPLIVPFDEVAQYQMLSFPRDIILREDNLGEQPQKSSERLKTLKFTEKVKPLEPWQREVLGAYSEEFSWEKRDYNREFVLQPHVQLQSELQAMIQKAESDSVKKLLQKLADGGTLATECILDANETAGLSSQDVRWINALLLLSRTRPAEWDDNTWNRNHKYFRMSYMAALIYIRDNLVRTRESARDWFLLACAYQRLMASNNRAVTFSALQNYMKYSSEYFEDNTWKLFIHLYGDCNELEALSDVPCRTDEQIREYFRALIYIMYKCGYECGNQAWKLHELYEQYQDSDPALLYDFALEVVEKFYIRTGNYFLSRVRKAFDCVLNRMEQHPEQMEEQNAQAQILDGVVVECRDRAKILGMDLMLYSYYCGETEIRGLLNAQENADIQECIVTFRRGQKCYRARAEIDDVLR